MSLGIKTAPMPTYITSINHEYEWFLEVLSDQDWVNEEKRFHFYKKHLNSQWTKCIS